MESYTTLLARHKVLVIAGILVGIALGFVLGLRFDRGAFTPAAASASESVYLQLGEAQVGGAAVDGDALELAQDLAYLSGVPGALGVDGVSISAPEAITNHIVVVTATSQEGTEAASATLDKAETAIAKKAEQLVGRKVTLLVQGERTTDDGRAAMSTARKEIPAFALLGAFLGFCVISAFLLLRRDHEVARGEEAR